MANLPKIYVAGHRGMVGSAIVRTLQQRGLTNIVTRTRAELDLTDSGRSQHLLHGKARSGLPGGRKSGRYSR